MGRIQGLDESGLLTENKLLKTGPGEVHSITIAYAGATAGQKVILRDGVNGAATPEVSFVIPGTDGTLHKEWPQGKAFDTGIYYDEGPGEVETEITFK